MYEFMRTDYAVKLPHIEWCILWLFRQAKAYFSNGDYDEAEATVLHGFREIFSVHGEEGGLALEEFGVNVNILVACYDRKMLLGYLDCGDKRTAFLFATLTVMLSVSNLFGERSADVLAATTLKPAFHNSDCARRAVIKALQSSSVESFREAVSSWEAGSREIKLCSKFTVDAGNAMGAAQELKRQSTERARSHVRQVTHAKKALCDNPGCTQEKVLLDKPSRCSRCKASFYCSRECQVAHWKVRKHAFSAATK